jgi:hypothetical protein
MRTRMTSIITMFYLHRIRMYNIPHALQEGYKHANKKLSNQVHLLPDGVFS